MHIEQCDCLMGTVLLGGDISRLLTLKYLPFQFPRNPF